MSSDIIITVEHLTKRYKLGQIGATSLRESAEERSEPPGFAQGYAEARPLRWRHPPPPERSGGTCGGTEEAGRGSRNTSSRYRGLPCFVRVSTEEKQEALCPPLGEPSD